MGTTDMDLRGSTRWIDDYVRLESGVVQFGNDWPGVFFRGDDALGLAEDIERLLNSNLDPEAVKKYLMSRVVEPLRACRFEPRIDQNG